jgi:hypothetical protein
MTMRIRLLEHLRSALGGRRNGVQRARCTAAILSSRCLRWVIRVGSAVPNGFERPLPSSAGDLKPSCQHVAVPKEIFAPLATMLPSVSQRRHPTVLAGSHSARCIGARAQLRLTSSQVMDDSHGTAPTFRCGQSLRSVLRLRQRLEPADFGVNLLEPRAPGSTWDHTLLRLCHPATHAPRQAKSPR